MNDLISLRGASVAGLLISLLGMALAIRPLYTSARRRLSSSGPQGFMLQHAPRLAALLLVPLFAVSSLALRSGMAESAPSWKWSWLLSIGPLLPTGIAAIVSWCGVIVLALGWGLLLAGWYGLGSSLSQYAELLPDHELHADGIFAHIMHPVYSGVFHVVAGASLLTFSPLGFFLGVSVVVPLFHNRAIQEEKLLLARFGAAFTDYGNRLGWRRYLLQPRRRSR